MTNQIPIHPNHEASLEAIREWNALTGAERAAIVEPAIARRAMERAIAEATTPIGWDAVDTSADPLAYTRADFERAQVVDEAAALLLLAMARILARTDWPSLAHDDRAELLEALRFNSDELLAELDEEIGR